MKYLLILITLLSLQSCGGEQVVEEEYTGRDETKKVEALNAVGHDGTGVRKNVDKLLDTVDKRNEEMGESPE